MICVMSGQIDKFWEPQNRRQFRKKSCIHFKKSCHLTASYFCLIRTSSQGNPVSVSRRILLRFATDSEGLTQNGEAIEINHKPTGLQPLCLRASVFS
jgi:hypothetical protein